MPAPEIRGIHVPAPLRDLPLWLCWRLESPPGEVKARKIPYYPSGERRHGTQGSPEDLAKLTTFAAARDAAVKRDFDGVGFAHTREGGVVTMDFDACVTDGKVDPVVLDLVVGTYAEYSPSGKGIHAIFLGDPDVLANHKSHATDEQFGVEAFSYSGFTTFTGWMLDHVDLVGDEDTIAPLPQRLVDFCRARFGASRAPSSIPDDPFAGLEPKVGLTVEKMEQILSHVSADVGRDEWIRVGMALHHEREGDDTGFDLWDTWSADGATYPGTEELRTQWESFDRRGGSGQRQVTMASVIHMAKARGYVHTRAKQALARPADELLNVAKALGVDDRTEISSIVTECLALGPVDQRLIFDAIKKSTGIPLGVLKEQREQEQGAKPDHLALARRVIELKGADNILCTDAHTWGWQGSGVWAVLDDRAVKQDVQAALDRVPGLDVYSTTVNSVADVLKTEVFVQGHEFNRGNPEVVNCVNGQVELRDGGWALIPHRREDYRTTQLPVAYDPNATAPKFEVFLDQIFDADQDGPEKRQALLELFGYSLMSHARHEKFAILIGAGANGKSVLLSVLYALAGPENVAGVQPSNFDNRFQRAHLHQKLANIVTELRQGEVIADAELKAITSGEPATVEHKHQDPFVMRPFATCWFGTNHMPHTRDFSEALFRRATILTFNRVFAPNEQDPLLKDKLEGELPGILTLALNAYAAALMCGFTTTRSSEAAKNEWRLEADQVAMFVDEACERDQNAQTSVGELYRAYRAWASDGGIGRTVSKKSMRDRLTRLGFGSHRDGRARRVTGLRLGENAQRGWYGLSVVRTFGQDGGED
jgi:putative DNA primase/helicase